MFKMLRSGQIYGFWLITLFWDRKWRIGETGELEYFNGGKVRSIIAYPGRRELETAIARNRSREDYINHEIKICRVK